MTELQSVTRLKERAEVVREPRMFWFALTLLTLSVVGGAGLAVVDALPVKIALVVWPIVPLSVAMAARWSRADTLVVFVMMAAAMMSGWLSVRLVPEVTVADLLLIVAAFPVGAMLLRGNRPKALRRMVLPLSGVLLIAVGGLIGGLVGASSLSAAIGQLGRFAASTALVLLLVAVWAPPRTVLRLLFWAYLVGASVNGVVAIYVEWSGSGRAVGFSGHPNHLGISCALALGVGLALIAGGGKRGSSIGLLLLVPVGVAIIVSGSRAGLLGGSLTLALYVLLLPKRGRAVLAVGTIVGLAAILLASGQFRLGTTNAITRALGDPSSIESDERRGVARDVSLTRVTARPLTGSGFERAQEAHSLYLQAWDAAGVLGLIGIGLVGVSVIRLALSAWRRRDRLLAGVASSLVGYFLASVFQNNFWDRYVWLILALGLALEREGTTKGTDHRTARLAEVASRT